MNFTRRSHAGNSHRRYNVQQPAENQYETAGNRSSRRRCAANSITQMPDWYTEGRCKPTAGSVTFTTWHHCSAGDQLLESGLIGPVLLRTAVPLAER